MTGESIFYLTDELKKEEPTIERPEIDQPTDNISLLMNDKIETKSMLSFLKDFIDTIVLTRLNLKSIQNRFR